MFSMKSVACRVVPMDTWFCVWGGDVSTKQKRLEKYGYNINTNYVDKCLQLHKSIYGLKQASRLCNHLLVIFFQQLGFIECPYNTCLMYDVKSDQLVLVGDILLCTSTEALADEELLNSKVKFNCVTLGNFAWLMCLLRVLPLVSLTWSC